MLLSVPIPDTVAMYLIYVMNKLNRYEWLISLKKALENRSGIIFVNVKAYIFKM